MDSSCICMGLKKVSVKGSLYWCDKCTCGPSKGKLTTAEATQEEGPEAPSAQALAIEALRYSFVDAAGEPLVDIRERWRQRGGTSGYYDPGRNPMINGDRMSVEVEGQPQRITPAGYRSEHMTIDEAVELGTAQLNTVLDTSRVMLPTPRAAENFWQQYDEPDWQQHYERDASGPDTVEVVLNRPLPQQEITVAFDRAPTERWQE